MDPRPGDWIRQALVENEGKLLIYAARILGDLDLARDAVQDTFLRLCKEPRSKVEAHLTPWLYTVCRNRCYEMKRKDKRLTPLDDAALARQQTDEPHPDQNLQRRDDVGSLRRAIDELPERQQEVVRLKFQNGLSYKEISEVTQLSVSHVGVILHNAMKTIRKQVRSESNPLTTR